jgi:hypothetical protein
MENCVFWDVTPCGSCRNLTRFLGSYKVLTRATRRNIPEDTIFQMGLDLVSSKVPSIHGMTTSNQNS